MVVADALRDDRFRDNPLVVGEPHIRFYAGSRSNLPRGSGSAHSTSSTRSLASPGTVTWSPVRELALLVQRELRHPPRPI